MTKRVKFILTSIILSLGFVGINFLEDQYKFATIAVLGLIAFVLFIWSLIEGLGFDMTLTTLILPVYFTISVGLFWFLLPSSLLARIPVVIFFGLGIYSLCLTANIYTVSAIRTIALLRAARGVGFVLTLITCFLIYDTMLSIKAPIYILSPAMFLLSLPLFFQGYWSFVLDKNFSKDLVMISLISSLTIGELALGLYFWPVSIVAGSLFFTVAVYILLGLGQSYLEGRLFPQTVREYLTLGLVVLIVMLLATPWGE